MTEQAKSLSTAELETLISDLAEIRAGMSPAVSRTPPEATDEDVRVIPQDDPSIQARMLRDGRIRLWMRHGGLGWLVFHLNAETSVTLREFFIANTDQNARPALISQQGGSRH